LRGFGAKLSLPFLIIALWCPYENMMTCVE
jgi:hypothetical protein